MNYANRSREACFTEGQLQNALADYKRKYATERRAEMMGRVTVSLFNEARDALCGLTAAVRPVEIYTIVPKHALIISNQEGEDAFLFTSVCAEMAKKRQLEHHIHLIRTAADDARSRVVAYFWFADSS